MTSNIDINKLTNKKKQYLQDAIFDKNGAYTYLDDPIEYKKARKRLQNRESAPPCEAGIERSLTKKHLSNKLKI